MQPKETHHFFYFCVMIGLCISASLLYTSTLQSPSSSIWMNLCYDCDDRKLAKAPSARSSKKPPQDYLVQTEGCTIPDFPLTHPDIAKFTFVHVKELVCSDKLPLTEESGLDLLFYDERLPDYGTTKYAVNCSYQGIERITEDRKSYGRYNDQRYRLKEKTPLFQRQTAIDDDAVYVTCTDSLDLTKTIYKAVHEFIQPRRAQAKRDKFKSEEDSSEEREKLNVIIMGTDSVSRANLQRHMPKTYEYLTNELHAIDLQGLNKIADNTHPNIVAILMGLSLSELGHHNCKKGYRNKKIFDDCPLIWKEFGRNGYVTVYAEDTTHVGSFHHGLYGFVKEPTDYYNRPYQKAAEKLTGHNGGVKGAVGHLCLGAKPCNEVIHNYSLAAAEVLKDVPYFAYYWTTSVTHDAQEWALRADEPSYNYLKSMNEGGFLNNSVLFFISDHGMRHGEFRTTYPGRLEERLPYANIVFPPWFRKKYPEAMANMEANTKKLTSTYDLHVTIRDILERNYRNITISTTKSHRGKSLFQVISTKRKCSDAGIPDQYCTCENTEPVDANDASVKIAAKKAVEVLNLGLANFSDCAQLTLKKVLKGRIRVHRKSTNPKPSSLAKRVYIVTFVTEPGGAAMEATVQRNNDGFKLTGEILRVNRYGNQSHCISDQTYIKYCYCKDLLT